MGNATLKVSELAIGTSGSFSIIAQIQPTADNSNYTKRLNKTTQGGKNRVSLLGESRGSWKRHPNESAWSPAEN